MKTMRKTLSVFLAVLMMVSCLTAGFYAMAADTDDLVKDLAYHFFELNGNDIATENVNVTNSTDSFKIYQPGLASRVDNYDVENKSGDYVYQDDSGKPVRSVAYTHTVTASDDSNRTIYNTYSYFEQIFKTYYTDGSTANKTPNQITDEIKLKLKNVIDDSTGDLLFFDGYTYYVDALGNIVSRSKERTYTAKQNAGTGDVDITYNKYDDNGAVIGTTTVESEQNIPASQVLGGITEHSRLAGSAQSGQIYAKNLYELMNVDTIIDYFVGNCTAANSGTWFHTYIFDVKTDVNYILENEEPTSVPIQVDEHKATFKMGRLFDDSGTQASYYTSSWETEDEPTKTDNSRYTLMQLKDNMHNYFNEYYVTENGKQKLETMSVSEIKTAYNNVTSYYNTFAALSNKAQLNFFGQDAYQYMNLVTQLSSVDVKDPLFPKRTSVLFDDDNGKDVTYQVTSSSVGSVVSTIDSLLKNEALGRTLKPILDMRKANGDELVEGLSNITGNTPYEMLQNAIRQYLFSDNIVNLILENLYPLITNNVDKLLTDDFIQSAIKNAVGSTLGDLVNSLANSIVGSSNGGWQALIYAVLVHAKIGAYPSAFAYVMDCFGYSDEFKSIYNVLSKSGGGSRNSAGDFKESDFDYNGVDVSTKAYANTLIGSQFDSYCGNRWKDVDWGNMIWGINGDSGKFKDALTCALAPFTGVLACILGNQTLNIKAAEMKVLLITYNLNLKIEGQQIYDEVLLPLLEMLGITTANGLKTQVQVNALADEVINGNDFAPTKGATSVNNFLQSSLINPLISWVTDTLLASPISEITKIVVNLSYYLTSYALLDSIKKIEIPLKINIKGGGLNPSFSVYTLKVSDLLGDKLDFLDSLQGIIDLIGISTNTGRAVIGYYDPTLTYKTDSSGTYVKDSQGQYVIDEDKLAQVRIYQPTQEGYDATTMTQAAYVGYTNPSYVDSETGELLDDHVSVDTYGKVEWSNDLAVYLAANGDNTFALYGNSYDYASLVLNVGDTIPSDKLSSATIGDVLYKNAVGQVCGYFNDKTNTAYKSIPMVTDDNGVQTQDDPENYKAVYRMYSYTRYVDESTPETAYVLYDNVSSITDPAEVKSLKLVTDTSLYREKVSLVAIMDYKLQSTGTEEKTSSIRSCELSAGSDGSTKWALGTRKYINLTNEGEGLVILAIFRYIFSVFHYREWDKDKGDYTTETSLVNAFLTNDTLNNELVYGLTLDDIFNSLALHPDECIAALYELLTPTYSGERPENHIINIVKSVAEGKVVTGKSTSSDPNYKYNLFQDEAVYYGYDTLSEQVKKYNDSSFGPQVQYSEYWTRDNAEYVVDNIDDVINNITSIFSQDSILHVSSKGELSGLIGDAISNAIDDETLSSLMSSLFTALDGVISGGGLADILKNAVGLDYSKEFVSQTLAYVFGTVDGDKNPVYNKLASDLSKDNTIYDSTTFYAEDGTPLVWGVGSTDDDVALRNNLGLSQVEMLENYVVAFLAPFAIAVKWLGLGQDITACNTVDTSTGMVTDYQSGILDLPGYEGYQYAWIPLMHALSATDNLQTYEQYFKSVYLDPKNTTVSGSATTLSIPAIVVSNVNTIKGVLDPVAGLIDKVISDPISTVLNMLPNLFFYLSIGALSDTINNLVQPAYVIIDIVAPIVDALPIVNKYLANVSIGGVALNLSLPLDFDFNDLANSLITMLSENYTTFNIKPKNLKIGTGLEYITQPFTAMPVLFNEDTSEPVIDESIYSTLTTKEKAHYKPMYTVVREGGSSTGNVEIDNNPDSETYGQIMYSPVLNDDGEQVYCYYDENGSIDSTNATEIMYQNCYIKNDKESPVYKLDHYDLEGNPVWAQAYQTTTTSYQKASDGSYLLQDRTYNPDTRTFWEYVPSYDTTKPIEGEYQQSTKEVPYYAWGALKLNLPYIDFNYICSGTLTFTPLTTDGIEKYVELDSAGGGDFLTLVLRLAMEILEMPENEDSLVHFLNGAALLTTDEESTLRTVIEWIVDLAKNTDVVDKLLGYLFKAYKFLVPVLDGLADKFKDPNNPYTLNDLLDAVGEAVKNPLNSSSWTKASNILNTILNSGTKDTTSNNASDTIKKVGFFARILELFQRFFNNLRKFFKAMIGK